MNQEKTKDKKSAAPGPPKGAIAKWWSNPDRRKNGQRFGMGVSLATAVMSALAFYRGHEPRMQILTGVSATLLALALVLPDILYPIAWLLEETFKAITKTMMYITLTLAFFIVFTPAGLVIRVLGKDPLQIKLDPQARSYWMDRPPRDPDRVEKQF